MSECNICGAQFASKQNMYRHKRTICLPKNENNELTQLTNKLKLVELQNMELEKTYCIALKEIEYLKKIIDDLMPFKDNYISVLKESFDTNNKVMSINSETIKLNAESYNKSLSTIKYISKKLNRAPSLKYQKDEIIGLLEHNVSKKYKPIDYIIYNYSIKKLDKWLGDIIIQIYKKENPFDQSIWATDSSRFSYLICDVIKCASGTKHEWITDKSGIKVAEIIINPTMNLLHNMLNVYLQESLTYDVSAMSLDEMSKLSNNRQKSNEIMKEIKDNNLHKEVLKYITPFFTADLTKIEDAINKSLCHSAEKSETSNSLESIKSMKKKNIFNIKTLKKKKKLL
jgi:hypothetical protein